MWKMKRVKKKGVFEMCCKCLFFVGGKKGVFEMCCKCLFFVGGKKRIKMHDKKGGFLNVF